MPVYDRICPEGHESRDVYVPRVGDPIPCRTCGKDTTSLQMAAALKPVTWPGGLVFENLGNTPQKFYSPAEKYQYMKKHGIEEFVRHQTAVGTDKSPHTSSWAAIGPGTLESAAAMLERVGKGSGHAPAHPGWVQSMTVTVTEVVESVRGSLT